MSKKNPYSHIESLEDLKQFACPRYQKLSEWYLKCVSCKGKCSAGERAIELLDESTAAKLEEEKAPAKYDVTKNPKVIAHNKAATEETRMLFRKVFDEPGDPIENLMKKRGITRERARNTVNWWIKSYPDIAEEVNARERCAAHSHRVSKTESEKRYKEASSHEDPIGYLVATYGLGKYNAQRDYTRWLNARKNDETSVKQESDDISIDDFLKEHPAEEKHEDEPDALRFSHHPETPIAKVESVEETNDGLKVVAKPINPLARLSEAVRKIGGLFEPEDKPIATVGDVLDLIDEYLNAKIEIRSRKESGDLTDKTAQICTLLIDDQLAKIRELEVNQ